jgi:hypothetical protein
MTAGKFPNLLGPQGPAPQSIPIESIECSKPLAAKMQVWLIGLRPRCLRVVLGAVLVNRAEGPYQG